MGKRKHFSTFKLMKVGIFLVFFTMVFLLYSLIRREDKLSVENDKKNDIVVNQENTNSEKDTLPWVSYANEDYGFVMSHPEYLYEMKSEKNERYVFFVMFQETKYSRGDGVAVGLSESPLLDVADSIKGDFKDNYGIQPYKEDEYMVDDYEGLRIDYKGGEDYQDRSIVVFNNGEYTFSISTTPRQIDRVVASFNFNI
jgi:hypothetical protein